MFYERFFDEMQRNFLIEQAVMSANKFSREIGCPVVLHGSVGKHLAFPNLYDLRRNPNDQGLLDVDLSVIKDIKNEEYKKNI